MRTFIVIATMMLATAGCGIHSYTNEVPTAAGLRVQESTTGPFHSSDKSTLIAPTSEHSRCMADEAGFDGAKESCDNSVAIGHSDVYPPYYAAPLMYQQPGTYYGIPYAQ